MQYKANRLPVTRLRVTRHSRHNNDWPGTLAWVVVIIVLFIALLSGCATTLNWTF